MYLLDDEISLENIREAIWQINQIMYEGIDEIRIFEEVRKQATELIPLIATKIQCGEFESHWVYGMEIVLTPEGVEREEEWPRLVEGLNNIFKFLSFSL